jgi:IS605 OrfB family transposase
MQTVSLPYRCSAEDRTFLDDCRRVYAAAVRTAYANAIDPGGVVLKQKPLRDLVKSRFAGGVLDAWALHCATLEGMELRKRVPDGRMVFGGRKNLERRQKGLIEPKDWKRARLRPMTLRGDKQFAGNRHFRLSADGRSCTFTMLQGGRIKGKPMVRRSVTLQLPEMTGNAGEVLRQAAVLAAAKKINLTFRIDDTKLHVTLDPADLPDHPERKRPVGGMLSRAIGVDLNPNWIGIAAVENSGDPGRLDCTKPLDWALVELATEPDAPRESVTELLAQVCARAIGMARKFGAATIAVEDGLGKLRSAGPARDLNRTLNYWARNRLVAMLRRKANLAGITVVEVRGAYSTMIGNLAFEAPDACASAMEIARRGIAVRAKVKDLLPVFDEGWRDGLRKDLALPAEAEGWAEVHRAIKAAKLGVRRPHPRLTASDPGGRLPGGIAVRRLGQRRRPGLIARPVGTCQLKRDSSEKRQLVVESTRYAG